VCVCVCVCVYIYIYIYIYMLNYVLTSLNLLEYAIAASSSGSSI
jgi:hypothetical protein